ncbi:hypothetical protein H8E77_34365 [bacterium]|nr:hypothetical protein [bacterium]
MNTQNLITGVVIFVMAMSMGCQVKNPPKHNFMATAMIRSEMRREYPQWFMRPPLSESTQWAVGYCSTYFRQEESLAQAVQDGIHRLGQSLAVRVTGERIFLNDNLGWRLIGEKFEITVPEAVIEDAKERHKVVQTYVDKHLTLVLVSLSDAAEQLSLSNTHAPMPDKPKWVEQPPQQPGYLYAQGHCDWYYHEEEAWEAAERNALISLALARQMKLRKWLTQWNEWTEAISTERTDVLLEGIQVVARWRDDKTKDHYVLIRMRLAL